MKHLESSATIRLRAVSTALLPPALPWWCHALLVVAFAGVAASIVHLEFLKLPGVHWHTALFLGLSGMELILSVVSFLLSWRWWRVLGQSENGWPLRAYEEFNTWLIESKSPLDKRNLRESAHLLTDSVEQQSSFGYVYYALVGIILTVPAFISLLYVASLEGAKPEELSHVWLPFALVIGASALTLSFSGGSLLLVRAGLGLWLVETCDRRSMAVAGLMQDHAPSQLFHSADLEADEEAAVKSGHEPAALSADTELADSDSGLPDDPWDVESAAETYAEETTIEDEDAQDSHEWRTPGPSGRRTPWE